MENAGFGGCQKLKYELNKNQVVHHHNKVPLIP